MNNDDYDGISDATDQIWWGMVRATVIGEYIFVEYLQISSTADIYTRIIDVTNAAWLSTTWTL